MDKTRTADKAIYLEEDRYNTPKEYFKRIVELVKQNGTLSKDSLVCDFGCASGEFLYYFSQEVPNGICRGYDVVPELIEKAQLNVKGVFFSKGNVLNKELLPSSSVDISVLNGVLQIFDDFEPCLSNLIKWTKKSGGRIYIIGLFNQYPIDVWIKYRLVPDMNCEHREPGWNIFSKKSISDYLDNTIGFNRHTFYPFQMPFDICENKNDPTRTWTITTDTHKRLLINGLSIICNIEILEIKL